MAEDGDALTFQEEHLLGNKPMQVDLLIIKKSKNHKIHKSIGHIFLGHNIVEYKSPDDVLSINDFYKVCGYAPGIYHLVGALFPIQILIAKNLSPQDYYWIQNLRKDLKSGGEIRRLIECYDPNKKSKLYQSVMNVILQAKKVFRLEKQNLTEDEIAKACDISVEKVRHILE